MGACFSARKNSSSSSNPSSPTTSRSSRRKSSKSSGAPAGRHPVPEPEAEETVKEVLSETPKPRPPQKPRDDGVVDAYVDKKLKQQQQQQRDDLLALDKGFSALLVPVDDGFCSNYDDRSEDASDAFSESLSTSTATVADKQDLGEVEKVRRRNHRSPARVPPPPKYQRKRSLSSELGCRRESSVAVRCGSGRSAQQQSPATRAADAMGPAVARTNSAREMGHAARSRVTSGGKRDPGERSASPSAKRAADSSAAATLAQYRGARANGRAPVATEEPAKQREGGGKGSGEEEGSGEGKESLDNPLVSLECFIFL